MHVSLASEFSTRALISAGPTTSHNYVDLLLKSGSQALRFIGVGLTFGACMRLKRVSFTDQICMTDKLSNTPFEMTLMFRRSG
jgi:hypothetical protein